MYTICCPSKLDHSLDNPLLYNSGGVFVVKTISSVVEEFKAEHQRAIISLDHYLTT